MQEDLIFDLGMNNGDDTDFYLRKGFRVVAVEANPDLCALAKERFAQPIHDGRVRVINMAIARSAGEVDLFINQEVSGWTTTDESWLQTRSSAGTQSRKVRVPAGTVRGIAEEHGVPYYLKADLQGMELACLESLLEIDGRPRFFSIATGLEIAAAQPAARGKRVVELFTALGYRNFKVVEQASTEQQQCPDPAREGLLVNYRFPHGSSGLFGRELPGRWMNAEETLREYRSILWSYRFAGNSRWPWPSAWFKRLPSPRLRYYLDRLFPRGTGWYDTHAMYDGR